MMLRLIVSLAFVVAVLWFAARMAKKRGLGTRSGLIEVLDRQPLSRTSSVTVVRVPGRVLVVGATEQQILADYPQLEPDDFLAVYAYAAKLAAAHMT